MRKRRDLALYGVYAVLAWGIVLFIGGALVLVLPGLAVRRRVARCFVPGLPRGVFTGSKTCPRAPAW